MQRVDATGKLHAGDYGMAVCTTVDQQTEIDIVNTGVGKAILCWQDYRDEGLTANIYAQSVTIPLVPEEPPIPGFELLYMCLGLLTIIALYRAKIKIKN